MMFIEWGEQIDVDRERLPYVWQYDSLKGEIDQVVTYPDQPEKLSISTRYGILNSGDGGKTGLPTLHGSRAWPVTSK